MLQLSSQVLFFVSKKKKKKLKKEKEEIKDMQQFIRFFHFSPSLSLRSFSFSFSLSPLSSLDSGDVMRKVEDKKKVRSEIFRGQGIDRAVPAPPGKGTRVET